MKIYFDVQYTQPNATITNIGLVDENMTSSFYAIQTISKNQNVLSLGKTVDDAHLESHFLPSLLRSVVVEGERCRIRQHLLFWLLSFEEKIQFVSDRNLHDFLLLANLLFTPSGKPDFISPYCHDINQDFAKYLGVSDEDAFRINRWKFIVDNTIVPQELAPAKNNALDAAIVTNILATLISHDV